MGFDGFQHPTQSHSSESLGRWGGCPPHGVWWVFPSQQLALHLLPICAQIAKQLPRGRSVHPGPHPLCVPTPARRAARPLWPLWPLWQPSSPHLLCPLLSSRAPSITRLSGQERDFDGICRLVAVLWPRMWLWFIKAMFSASFRLRLAADALAVRPK
jgi:hypothetical protein